MVKVEARAVSGDAAGGSPWITRDAGFVKARTTDIWLSLNSYGLTTDYLTTI